MNDVHTDEIYGLLETAEHQQAALQANLERLAAERSALEVERERLVTAVYQLRDDISQNVVQAIENAMSKIADNGDEAIRSVGESLRNSLDGASFQARQMETSLRNLVRWTSWRLLSGIIAALSAIFLISWAASCATLWWNAGAIGRSQAKKEALQEQIALLESDSRLKGAHGLIDKLNSCGEKKRRCVQVDESAGAFGSDGDYRVVKGY